MSTYLHVQAPARPASPRNAPFLGRLLEAVQAYLKAQRAQHEARQRVRDAMRVRALADSMQPYDPGMASDLRCAVDRYY